MTGTELRRVRGELENLVNKPRPAGRRTTALVARALVILDAPEGAVGRPTTLSAAENPETIRAFQERSGINATGEVNKETLVRLHSEVSHAHVSGSRMRTARVQTMLGAVGFAPDRAEVDTKHFGDSTSTALQQFQDSVGLPTDGLAQDATMAALTDRALEVRLSTKTQTAKLQRSVPSSTTRRGSIPPAVRRNWTRCWGATATSSTGSSRWTRSRNRNTTTPRSPCRSSRTFP